MNQILPTGQCFDDALEYLAERLRSAPRDLAKRWRLAHGICRGNYEGALYAHAWLEEHHDVCWDFGLIDGTRVAFSMKKHEYYAARHVVECTLYTPRQALAENLRTQHFGPWKDSYRALCVSDDSATRLVGEHQVSGPKGGGRPQ
jgi:hypothetical protein